MCWCILICKKVRLANLKSDLDRVHIDRSKTVPNDLKNSKFDLDELDLGKLITAIDH